MAEIVVTRYGPCGRRSPTARPRAASAEWSLRGGSGPLGWTTIPGAPRMWCSANLTMGVGATGTPATFVNGRFLSGAQPYEAFKKLIDEELAKAQAKN